MTQGMTGEQRAIATIWREVLGLPREVGPTDNFLDLGGNSLRAGEIVWRMKDELGVEVTIDTLLDKETFEAFLRHIDSTGKQPRPAAN